jgi:hypothetical protein
MKGRKWDARTKTAIALEGLKGKPVTAICQDSHISQAQYDHGVITFSRMPPQRLRWSSKRNLKRGSNMRMPGSRSWSANSPWSSKKSNEEVWP